MLTLLLKSYIYSQSSPSPITIDMLDKVFPITTDTVSGTCFLIKIDNHEYIVTAKHLFRKKVSNGEKQKVKISINEVTYNLDSEVYFHLNDSVDIAIMSSKVNNYLDPQLINFLSVGGEADLGQEFYFLGYPILNGRYLETKNGQNRFPLIKHAYLSGWTFFGNVRVFLLDGINNPGFSGSPAICFDKKKQQWVLFGVVSGYLNYSSDLNNQTRKRKKRLSINQNTGITYIYDVGYIFEILNQNISIKH